MDNSYHCGNCGLEVKSYAADTARASEARLREALKQANDALEKIHDDWAEPSASAAGGQIANICLIASLSIDTALSGSSGEWLERHDAEKLEGLRHQLTVEAQFRCRAEAERDASMDRAAQLDRQTCSYAITVRNLEAERDGLAAFISSLQRSMSGSRGFVYVDGVVPGTFSDGPAISAQILAARDARIKAEARRGALVEAYERVKNLRGCNAYDVIDSIEEMAQGADHA